MINLEYKSLRYAQITHTETCYICGLVLRLGDASYDHIIPEHLFDKHDPYRPTLPVHKLCNNLKSKDDLWVVKQIQLRCSFDSRADKSFSNFMDKAIIEKKDAYIIGEKLRNYKLARGLFDNTVWGLELFHGGQNIHQLRFPEKDVRRVEKYMKTLCRGLYIRSNPNSNPVSPELSWLQYVAGSLNGTGSRYLEAVKTLVNSSSKYLFGQRWGNQLFYIGSRCAETDSAGFLFIQFYSQLGVLAFFDKKSS